MPPGTSDGDSFWMRRALAVARKGLGRTAPNPMVGAIVLDSEGRCVGKGFHARAGAHHAEITALNQAGSRARGGTLIVTLEPCVHQGRTPPCVDRVIASGVKAAVIASRDPNPLVNGAGVDRLRSARIEVRLGAGAEIERRLNAAFRTMVAKGRPHVIAKAAVSLDRRMGCRGRRILISGPLTERTTMRLRAWSGAILVGAATVATDDPALNVRGKYSDRSPIRAIAGLPPSLPKRIFTEAGGPVLVFLPSSQESHPMRSTLEKAGARIITLKALPDGSLDPADILSSFHGEGIAAVLLEGGADTIGRFFRAGLIDEWVFYLCPVLLGEAHEGRETSELLGGGAFPLRFRSVIRRGGDFEIHAEA